MHGSAEALGRCVRAGDSVRRTWVRRRETPRRRPAGPTRGAASMASNEEYEASRGMPAPREVVFDLVSDPGLVHRWVPALDEVSETGTDAVHVHGELAGHEV